MRGKGTIGFFFLLMLLWLAGAGCSLDVRTVAGSPPDLDLLDTRLRVGESSRADVLKALGEPMGKGRAQFPMDPQLRTATMWSYYYEEGDLNDARRVFLYVFFGEDRLEAYMWFSSLSREQLRARTLKR
jgi:hypothetical protein